MRDRVINRLREIGYSHNYPRTDVMKTWKKPKHVIDRLMRQHQWVQNAFDSGVIPTSFPLEELDDETLLMFFERTTHLYASNGAQSQSSYILCEPKAIFYGEIDQPELVNNFAHAVEFKIYHENTNTYNLPDMLPVRQWLNRNATGEAIIWGMSFAVFKNADDAILCWTSFR